MSSEDIERLNRSIQMQVTYSIQMNTALREQISLMRDMINGFRTLADALKQISNQFWQLGKFISDLSLLFKSLSPAATQANLLEKNMKKASDAVDKDASKYEKSLVKQGAIQPTAPEELTLEKEDDKKGLWQSLSDTFKKTFEPIKDVMTTLSPLVGGVGAIKAMTKVPHLKGENDEDMGRDWKGILKAPFQNIGNAMKPLSAEFAKLGPQMMATALITQPLQKILEGVFSAFEPILDVFGMFGELLGLIIQPITNEVALAMVNLITQMTPMIPALQEFALGLFNLIMPIFATINRMTETGESFGTAMAFVISEALAMIIEGLTLVIPALGDILGKVMLELVRFIPTFLEAIQPAVMILVTEIAEIIKNAITQPVSEAGAVFSLGGGFGLIGMIAQLSKMF